MEQELTMKDIFEDVMEELNREEVQKMAQDVAEMALGRRKFELPVNRMEYAFKRAGIRAEQFN